MCEAGAGSRGGGYAAPHTPLLCSACELQRATPPQMYAYGYSVATDGEYVVVGAPGDSDNEPVMVTG